MKQPLDDSTRARVAWYDSAVAILERRNRAVTYVESEAGGTGAFVKAVAAPAVICEDGPHIAARSRSGLWPRPPPPMACHHATVLALRGDAHAQHRENEQRQHCQR